MPSRATKRGARADPSGRCSGRRWSAARRSPGWPLRESWRGPAPTCSSSTATRSASARRRPARRRTEWIDEPRPGGRRPPELQRARRSTPRSAAPLAPAVALLHLRLPAALRAAAGRRPARRASRPPPSRGARATAIGRHVVHTDRGDLRRRSSSTRSAGGACCRARRRSSRPRRGSHAGSRSILPAAGERLRAVARPGLHPRGVRVELPGRRRAARRRGLVRPARPGQGADRAAGRRLGRGDDGYQGNWIPHKIRDATEDGVFFAGDWAGHCLPATAEGIRPALYFGLAWAESCATWWRAARRASRR